MLRRLARLHAPDPPPRSDASAASALHASFGLARPTSAYHRAAVCEVCNHRRREASTTCCRRHRQPDATARSVSLLLPRAKNASFSPPPEFRILFSLRFDSFFSQPDPDPPPPTTLLPPPAAPLSGEASRAAQGGGAKVPGDHDDAAMCRREEWTADGVLPLLMLPATATPSNYNSTTQPSTSCYARTCYLSHRLISPLPPNLGQPPPQPPHLSHHTSITSSSWPAPADKQARRSSPPATATCWPRRRRPS